MLRSMLLFTVVLGAALPKGILVGGIRPQTNVVRPAIRYLHIKTDVAYRFATTKVASMLANRDNKAREAVFTIQLPKSAFITKFSMTIENIVYNGTVKAKEVARREYVEAKRRGQSAGHIATKTRNANKFDVSVNVAAQQKVTFNLTYEELLQRSLGMYQNVMYINPGQIVPDLKIDVIINESREITTIRVPELRKDVEESINSLADNAIAVVEKSSPKSAHIKYYPTVDQQKEINAKGLSGQLIVQYDVARDFDGGDIQVVDGYFVHFFAPSGLPPVKKNVVFILDISGSMSGRKIRQVKDAMQVILRDLQAGDLFNIILFDGNIFMWNSTDLVQATPLNIDAAETFVRNMRTRGATNINGALLRGIQFLDQQMTAEKALNPSSIIVFLTDGDPTSGVTNTDRILQNVRRKNEDRYSIFSLGFGDGVDFGFLRKISLQNNGIARKIYADSDAALQLQGFYKEISTPLLTDVNVEYLDIDNTTTITRRDFGTYFNGSEIVICGPFFPRDELDSRFRAVVKGNSNGNSVVIEKEVDVTSKTGVRASTEKLWAYLTIKQLLERMETVTNETKKADLKEEALRLSLKYSFVTSLTSMIVKKPGENATRSDLENSDNTRIRDRTRTSYMSRPSGYSGPSGSNSGSAPVVNNFQPRLHGVSHDLAGRPKIGRTSRVHVRQPTFLSLPHAPTSRSFTPTPTARVPMTSVSLTILPASPRLMVDVSGRIFCINWPIATGSMQVLFRDSRKNTVISGEFEGLLGLVLLKRIIIRNEAAGEEVEVDTSSVNYQYGMVGGAATWGYVDSSRLFTVVDDSSITIPENVLSRHISVDITRKQMGSNYYLVMRIDWRRRSRRGLSGLLSRFLSASTGVPGGSSLIPGNPTSTSVLDVFSGQQKNCTVFDKRV